MSLQVLRVLKSFRGIEGLQGLKGLVVLKAEVVDENTVKTIPGSNLVCVPNVVVVG